MEERDIRNPLYYVMGRKTDVDKVQRLLYFTPCYYGLANTPEDKSLLEAVVTEVLHVKDATACKEIAEHMARTERRPMLIMGDGQELKAVYSTGEEETVC